MKREWRIRHLLDCDLLGSSVCTGTSSAGSNILFDSGGHTFTVVSAIERVDGLTGAKVGSQETFMSFTDDLREDGLWENQKGAIVIVLVVKGFINNQMALDGSVIRLCF